MVSIIMNQRLLKFFFDNSNQSNINLLHLRSMNSPEEYKAILENLILLTNNTVEEDIVRIKLFEESKKYDELLIQLIDYYSRLITETYSRNPKTKQFKCDLGSYKKTVAQSYLKTFWNKNKENPDILHSVFYPQIEVCLQMFNIY